MTSTFQSQWLGRKVAFLGDSITDAVHVGTTRNYWQFLQESLGIEPLVYGINGHTWCGVFQQAEKLYAEHPGDLDAIIVFAGTNDFCIGTPLGDWYDYDAQEVNYHGKVSVRPRRLFNTDDSTFRGRINRVMQFLKTRFPAQQIILLTMIHRGFAEFGGDNIQPEESFPNDCGLYVDSYVEVIKEAGNVWAVPVIDLNALSGLFPTAAVYGKYFHNADNDRLHPAIGGHCRMAQALHYQLLALPSNFSEASQLADGGSEQ
ncbi:MAG: SGNH/GDSL hydrolase family protein [Lentisphaerae bacterium]|nr:SGNH/GDSL hydrolase family protein [Lentisphaerota bacterium]